MKFDLRKLRETVTRDRFWIVTRAAVVSVLLTACGGSQLKSDGAEIKTDSSKIVETSTASAVSREIPKYISANGSFAAIDSTRVAPEIAGIVDSVLVKEGDFVSVGSVIFKLSEKDARLRLDQARAAELQAQTQIRQAEANLKQTQAQIGLDKNGRFNADNVPAVRESRFALRSLESDLRLAEVNEKRYANLLETGDTSKIVYDQRRNELEKARSAVAEARERLTNAENAARGGNQAVEAARVNLENTRAGLESAKANTALAEKTVKDTTIRAPLAGFVSERPAGIGEYVSPSSPIITIVRTNPIKLRLNLPEAQAAEARLGMPVSASIAAFTERRFAGKVSAINPIVNENSRSLLVEAVFENSDGVLRPGTFVSANILGAGGNEAVFIPETAIVKNKDTGAVGVYVIEDETARFRVVELDEDMPAENGEVRIVTGVSADERVAVANIEKLFDGVKVSVRS